MPDEYFDKPEDPKHELLVKHAIDLYEQFKKSEYRGKIFQEIKDARNNYEQTEISSTFPWEGASNRVMPFEMITVDNLEPRLVAGLVAKDPVVHFDDNDIADKIDEILELWFNKELMKTVKVEELAINITHILLLEGTRFSIDQYEIKKKRSRDFIFDDTGKLRIDKKTGEPLYEEKENIAFEGVHDEQISFDKMFIPDNIGTQEEWDDCDKIREVEYTFSELWQKRKDNHWIQKNIGPWLLPPDKQRKLQEDEKSASQIIAGVSITGKETIKCLECHIKYPLKGLEEEDELKKAKMDQEHIIATIAVDSNLCLYLARRIELNMANESLIKRIRLFAEEGRSYGRPLHSKLKSVQDAAGDLFNRMINMADIVYLPFYFYEAGSGVEGKKSVMPGEGIPIKDVNKILFPKFNFEPRAFIDFFNIFVDMWERIGSIGETQMGKQADEKSTATEILALIQEGNIKHNYQAKIFREEFLSIIRTIYDLYYQYMPYDATISITDDKGRSQKIPFPRNKMKRGYSFRLTGSTEQSNQLIERKEAEDLWKLLRGDPLVNPPKLMEELLTSYKKEDWQNYVNPQINQLITAFMAAPQEIMGAVQEIMAEMQQQGGKGGQRPQGVQEA